MVTASHCEVLLCNAESDAPVVSDVTSGCSSLPIWEVHGLAGLLTGEQERLLKRSGLLAPHPILPVSSPASAVGLSPNLGGRFPSPTVISKLS